MKLLEVNGRRSAKLLPQRFDLHWFVEFNKMRLLEKVQLPPRMREPDIYFGNRKPITGGATLYSTKRALTARELDDLNEAAIKRAKPAIATTAAFVLKPRVSLTQLKKTVPNCSFLPVTLLDTSATTFGRSPYN